jgi:hypothetical protein
MSKSGRRHEPSTLTGTNAGTMQRRQMPIMGHARKKQGLSSQATSALSKTRKSVFCAFPTEFPGSQLERLLMLNYED